MPREIIKLFASTLADAAAQIDVPSDGVIDGIGWSMSADVDADADTFGWELAFASTSSYTSNDTRSSIYGHRIFASILTSGVFPTHAHGHSPLGLDVMVGAGERLYLHTTGTVTSVQVSVWIYFMLGGASRVPTRRR